MKAFTDTIDIKTKTRMSSKSFLQYGVTSLVEQGF